jgi:hypothetical protein
MVTVLAPLAFVVATTLPLERVLAAQPSAAPTSYGALMQALNDAATAAPSLVHVTTAGTSVDKRQIPLVVIGADLADGSAASVKAASKLRVWARAGVHGDAAEGTEAALALVRDMAAGKHSEWLTSIVLLVTPLANPDGHERVSADHVARRNGPVTGLGTRVNASNVDIDHDYARLDSPEARALVDVFASYDPHALIDLETGDNACAGYAITYRAPLNPNISDRLASLARNDWAPFVARNLRSKYATGAGPDGRLEGDTTCGLPDTAPPPAPSSSRAAGAGRRGASAGPSTPPSGAPARGTAAAARGRGATRGAASADGAGAADAAPPEPPPAPWTSLPEAPRAFASYFGMRNRVVLTGLSDGFLPFADRVQASTRFLEEAVAFTYAASARFEKAVETTDTELMVGATLATSWQPMLGGRIEISRGSVSAAADGSFARTSGSIVPATDRTGLQPDSTETMAAEYYIPEDATAVVDLLRKQGVQLRQLTQSTRGVEQFVSTGNALIADVDGHAMRKLTGTWQPAPSVVVPIGTWVVRMNQRAARLAFALLEPASNDGLVAWKIRATRRHRIPF